MKWNKTLGHAHPWSVTVVEKGGYNPPKKGIKLERNLSSNPSIIHPKRSLETHEIFHPEKSLRNQDMVKWDRHSATFTDLGKYMISYK